MPARERRSLDAVVEHQDGSRRVIEVDEAQHSNPHRALTLEHYPLGTGRAFNRALWHERSMASTKLRGGGWGKAKPPLFPGDGGRRLQRAFRDMLADLLPPAQVGPPRFVLLTSRSRDDSTRRMPWTGCVHSSRTNSVRRPPRQPGLLPPQQAVGVRGLRPPFGAVPPPVSKRVGSRGRGRRALLRRNYFASILNCSEELALWIHSGTLGGWVCCTIR